VKSFITSLKYWWKFDLVDRKLIESTCPKVDKADILKYAISSKYSHDALKVFAIAYTLSYDIDPTPITDPAIDSETAHVLVLCLIDGIDITSLTNIDISILITYRSIFNKCDEATKNKINNKTHVQLELLNQCTKLNDHIFDINT
jgi:hypothetical protein